VSGGCPPPSIAGPDLDRAEVRESWGGGGGNANSLLRDLGRFRGRLFLAQAPLSLSVYIFIYFFSLSVSSPGLPRPTSRPAGLCSLRGEMGKEMIGYAYQTCEAVCQAWEDAGDA
jgi:hypothetical protein